MKNQTVYRAGIVGLGEMGSSVDPIGNKLGHFRSVYGPLSHPAALTDHPRVSLVAGSSRNLERRQRFTQRWGVENVYADWRELLEREKLDIVSVCTTTPSHAEIVISAAAANVRAIFAEKPIATTLAEADQMVRACEEKNIELVINHTRRWESNFEKVRELVNDGVIGQLQHIDCQWARGRLSCVGTHFFDLIAWVVGAKAVSMMGILDRSNTPDPRGPEFRDPGGYGVILFENGVKAFINGSEHLTLASSIKLQGDRGEILISNEDGRSELWTIDEAGFGDGGLAQRQFPTPARKRYPMLEAVDEIVQVLDGVIPHSRSTGRDGTVALEMVVGFHLSDRENGKAIKLPPSGEDRRLEVRSG